MAGRAFLLATGSMSFDVKTKWVLTEPQQPSTAIFASFFQICGGLNYSRDHQVHRALFWAKSLKGENFLDNLSIDDVFRITIVQ